MDFLIFGDFRTQTKVFLCHRDRGPLWTSVGPFKVWPGSLKVWPGSLEVWPSSLKVWPSSSYGASSKYGASRRYGGARSCAARMLLYFLLSQDLMLAP